MKQSSRATSRQSRMKKVQQQLKNWRKNRRAKNSPIPEYFWEAAVELYGEYSISEISKALQLEYGKLKRLIFKDLEKKTEPTPGFIELDIPGAQPRQNEWAIEMENADGAKMKISGTGSEIPDIASICQNFLGGKQ